MKRDVKKRSEYITIKKPLTSILHSRYTSKLLLEIWDRVKRINQIKSLMHMFLNFHIIRLMNQIKSLFKNLVADEPFWRSHQPILTRASPSKVAS